MDHLVFKHAIATIETAASCRTTSRRIIPDCKQLPFARVILIVLDSVGIGELPDAAAYGDEGSNTLGNIARQVPLQLPTLRSLGLDRGRPRLETGCDPVAQGVR